MLSNYLNRNNLHISIYILTGDNLEFILRRIKSFDMYF